MFITIMMLGWKTTTGGKPGWAAGSEKKLVQHLVHWAEPNKWLQCYHGNRDTADEHGVPTLIEKEAILGLDLSADATCVDVWMLRSPQFPRMWRWPQALASSRPPELEAGQPPLEAWLRHSKAGLAPSRSCVFALLAKARSDSSLFKRGAWWALRRQNLQKELKPQSEPSTLRNPGWSLLRASENQIGWVSVKKTPEEEEKKELIENQSISTSSSRSLTVVLVAVAPRTSVHYKDGWSSSHGRISPPI